MLSMPWVLLAVAVPSAFLTIRYALSLVFALIVYLRDGREALKDMQPIIDAGARLPLPHQTRQGDRRTAGAGRGGRDRSGRSPAGSAQ